MLFLQCRVKKITEFMPARYDLKLSIYNKFVVFEGPCLLIDCHSPVTW